MRPKSTVMFSLAMALALLATVQAAYAADSSYGYLAQVTATRFLPSAIYNGNVVSLAVDIKNGASSLEADDMNVSMSVDNHLEPIQQSYYIGTIQAGDTKTAVLSFRVKDSTPPGFYSVLVTMKYTAAGVPSVQTETLQVPVSTSERNLEVSVNPTVIHPGQEEQLQFTLKNLSGQSVSNITFSWDEKNNMILPVGSDNKRYLSILDSGDTATLSYQVATDPSVTPGIYSLDISINFTDSNGARTDTSQVGLLVGGETDFEVAAEQLSSGQLSLSISNIGSNNAQGLVVKIPDQQGVHMASGTQVLGNLNKGDFTIATFDTGSSPAVQQTTQQAQGRGLGIIPIRVRVAGQGGETNNSNGASRFRSAGIDISKTSIDVQIDYTDTVGVRRSVTKTVPLGRQGLSSGVGGAASQGGGQDASGDAALLALALILVAGAAYNFARAKRDWKALGMRVVAAIILTGIVVFLVPGALLEMLAIAVSAGLVMQFFLAAPGK